MRCHQLQRLIGLWRRKKRQQHGSAPEQVPQKKGVTAQEREWAVVQQLAAEKAVPAASAVGLSDVTLSGLEQLEAQVIDDWHDPLILVGCVLEVPAWYYSGVCDTVWWWWQVQRSEGGKVREVRVKNFEQGHYRMKWVQRGKTTRVLRHGILRYKKLKVLEAPDAPQRQGSWSEGEKAAVVARRGAGEGYGSIALSFGRTVASVVFKAKVLLDRKYAPASGTGTKRTGHKVGWRLVATKALQQLPACSGTAKQVATIQCSQHSKLMGVAGAGGCAMDAGSVWEIRLWSKSGQLQSARLTDECVQSVVTTP